jgi:hypothetical protein
MKDTANYWGGGGNVLGQGWQPDFLGGRAGAIGERMGDYPSKEFFGQMYQPVGSSSNLGANASKMGLGWGRDVGTVKKSHNPWGSLNDKGAYNKPHYDYPLLNKAFDYVQPWNSSSFIGAGKGAWHDFRNLTSSEKSSKFKG